VRFHDLEDDRRPFVERDEFETLVRDKHVGPLSGFRSRKGKRFDAALKLSDEFKAEFDFGPNGQENGATQPVDFSRQEPLGVCPKCGGRIFEFGMSYSAKIQSALTRHAIFDRAK